MTKLAIILCLLVASSCAVLQGHARPLESQEAGHVVAAAAMDAGAASVSATSDECTYIFVTKTGDEDGDETFAVLTFQFWDAANNTFKRVVDGNQGDNFNQGKFTKIGPFTEKCMNPCRLKISSNWGRIEPAWFCEWAKINVMGIGRSNYWHKFVVNQWLGPYVAARELTIDECYGGVTTTMAAAAASVEDDRRLPSFSVI